MKANQCNSCNVMYINGVRCHEHGCPEAWRDYSKECKWCGADFYPEDKHQVYCCVDCSQIDS